MADFRGYEADVLIGADGVASVLYRCSRFMIKDVVSEKDMTIASDGGFYDFVDDVQMAEITLEHATYADDVNPFGTPFDLRVRQDVSVDIWPEGLNNGAPWKFPLAKVISIDHQGDSSALQPMSLILKSRGPYFSPEV